MGRKPPPDWEAIESIYRTNTLSNRQIADQFGISETAIRHRVKDYKWTRDLAKQVKEAASQKVLRDEVRSRMPANERREVELGERDLIEAASDVVAMVIAGQKTTLRKGERIADILLDQLCFAVENREAIEDAIEWDTRADKNPLRRSQMLAAVDLPAHAKALKDIMATVNLAHNAERKTYGILEKPTEPPPAPGSDERTKEMRSFMHEMLTRGPLATPGGQLKVIDVDARPAPKQQR